MKKNIIIDLIFLLIFFTSLILPTTHISQEKVAKNENRFLNTYVPLYDSAQKKINFNYGIDFENYLKDRFWGRQRLTVSDKKLNYSLAWRYAKFGELVLDKKKKFMYEHLIADRTNTDNEKKIINGLKAFNKFCAKNHIKFYPVIMPRKESVYPPDLVINNKNEEIKESVRYVSNQSGVKIIFTLDEILAQKAKIPYMLYHKTDHHATMDGAYIGYKTLMKELKKDFPQIEIAKPSDFTYFEDKRVCAEQNRTFSQGYTCKLVSIPKNICRQFLNINYRYFQHIHINNLQKIKTEEDQLLKYDFYYPNGADLKVMVFGDSFTANLMEYLPYSFKNTSLIRLNGPRGIKKENQYKILKYYEQEILKFKPDILITYTFYSDYAKLRDLASY